MTTYTKPVTLGDLVKYEVNPALSRETIILASGKTFALGAVLGKKRGSGVPVVSAATADSGNAGNGALTLAGTPYGANVREGTYRILFTAPTKANVENPQGENIGVATVGQAFAKDIAFTIAAGGNAFAAGDALSVGVSYPANDGVCDEWDPALGDGTGDVYGVLLWDVDTTGGAQRSVAIVRSAELSRDAIVFKNGTSAAAKLDAYAALSRQGLAIRETI